MPAQASDFDPGFYSDWPYIQPSDILPYIFENSAQGDAGAVIAAFDAFGEYYPMYKCGDEKGQILERLVKQVQPKVIFLIGCSDRRLLPSTDPICSLSIVFFLFGSLDFII
jgi:hypothetical protein